MPTDARTKFGSSSQVTVSLVRTYTGVPSCGEASLSPPAVRGSSRRWKAKEPPSVSAAAATQLAAAF